MRESIGSIALYNFIIIYIIITFGFMAGMVSYNKAFKINSRVIGAIEKYEGWNDGSQKEADNALAVLGYRQKNSSFSCPDRPAKENASVENNDSNYQYCVYYMAYDDECYYKYGVTTYIYLDLPIVGNLSFPIHGKSNRIYKFTDHQQTPDGKYKCSYRK